MFKAMIVGLIVGFGLTLGGCQTLTHDSDQHIRKYSRIAEVNRRMLAEDVDSLLLLDSQSGLSRWYVQTQ